MSCAASTWMRTDQGMDYVPCDRPDKTRLCRLEGLLLAVEVELCDKHENYFRSGPAGWKSVKVSIVEEKTCR